MIRRALCLLAAAVLLAAAARPAGGREQEGSLHLLDVPYLPQSEALCGGAAIAMVLRFFGATGVYAETFSSLVDPEAAGIRGQDLIDALRGRGWQADSFRGDAASVQAHLASRRPVVALIEDRPGRFHYVVVVGWAGGRVIVHDPARAPFRVLQERAFTEAWAASGFWTLAAVPGAASGASVLASEAPAPGRREAAPAAPCAPLIDEGVRLAGTGDLDAGRQLLEMAAVQCPRSAAPWREMAGIHALRNDWKGAAQDARRALARDGTDPLAWRTLATALFLEGDAEGALAAWNRVGEPLIDIVNVVGLERTRYEVVAREMSLHPQDRLTRGALEAARRRLSELPSALTTRLTYRPGERGRAQVDAVVLERPVVPRGSVALAAMGARLVTDRELAVSIASPTGGGELWTAAWRWWPQRPRVAAGFAAPGPYGGIWKVSGFSERQTYALPGRTGTFEESRRRAAFQVADWSRAGVRWQIEAGMDAWGSRRAAAVGMALEHRLAGERAALHGRIDAWGGGVRAWTAGVAADWRSATAHEGDVWIGRLGADVAAPGAPLAVWSGAGTGQGREHLLRAHPLLEDGVIRDGVFGRKLVHGGIEGRRWFRAPGTPVRIAPAVFVDAAKAAGGFEGADRRLHADAGGGLRVALPGAGVVRIDVARGLRDGRTVLSIGWTR